MVVAKKHGSLKAQFRQSYVFDGFIKTTVWRYALQKHWSITDAETGVLERRRFTTYTDGL